MKESIVEFCILKAQNLIDWESGSENVATSTAQKNPKTMNNEYWRL